MAEILVVELDPPAEEQSALASVLSARELERAGRLRCVQAKRRFTVCRGALRHVLAERLQKRPQLVPIRIGANGKPAVSASPAFNLARSHELAVIAVAERGQIGVDIEWIRPDRELSGVIDRLGRGERQSLERLEGDELIAAFHWCWTAKEAYLKGLGRGLAKPLESFEVSVALREPLALLFDRESSDNGEWSLARLEIRAGYAATVALQCGQPSVSVRRWSLTR
jgi:4'-phosphopantetheinyl transferase